jgi:hypothetical protein
MKGLNSRKLENNFMDLKRKKVEIQNVLIHDKI